MPKRFAATEAAAQKGLENVKPEAGAKLVGDWVTELAKLDAPGAKGLHADLMHLQKELGKAEPDGEAIGKLLGKIGPATVKMADKCDDEAVAEKIRSLGEALSSVSA